MPCYDHRDGEERAKAHKMLLGRLDTATRLLCYLMRTKDFDHPEIQEWWKEHEEQDAQRRMNEE